MKLRGRYSKPGALVHAPQATTEMEACRVPGPGSPTRRRLFLLQELVAGGATGWALGFGGRKTFCKLFSGTSQVRDCWSEMPGSKIVRPGMEIVLFKFDRKFDPIPPPLPPPGPLALAVTVDGSGHPGLQQHPDSFTPLMQITSIALNDCFSIVALAQRAFFPCTQRAALPGVLAPEHAARAGVCARARAGAELNKGYRGLLCLSQHTRPPHRPPTIHPD